MQFLILAAGKPSLGYAKEGVELYLNRLRPFGKTELKLVRETPKTFLNVCWPPVRVACASPWTNAENFGPQES